MQHGLQRVALAQADFLAGHSDVNGFAGQFAGDSGFRQAGLRLLQRLLNLSPHLVGQLARRRAFFRRKFAHAPQDGG